MTAAALEITDVVKTFKLYDNMASSVKERVLQIGRNTWTPFHALKGVTLDVQEGETVGLLGHNGSGKSTLLKCVAGTLRPTKGTITHRGRLAALLELGAGFHPDLTGRENVYLNGSILGLSRTTVDRIFDSIVDFSELESTFIDMQVKHYSSGMYARLAFAVAVNVDPDILLVDEVLSVGDEAFQRKCLDRVKQFQKEGRTILLVTHASDLVRQICDRAAVLDHGELVTFGSPGDSVRIYRETLLHRGIEIPPEAAPTVEEIVTGDITVRNVAIEYPVLDRSYVMPTEPLRMRIAYDARVPNDDVVLSLQVHDQDGNLMLGTDTDLLGFDMGKVDGAGEVVVDIERMPLQGGIYPLTLQLRSRNGGVVYDQRDQLDRFEVMQPQRIEGRVHFELAASGSSAGSRPEAVAAAGDGSGADPAADPSMSTGS